MGAGPIDQAAVKCGDIATTLSRLTDVVSGSSLYQGHELAQNAAS